VAWGGAGMKGIIKERRKDVPGYMYRFVGISSIQNDYIRRTVLIAMFPVFFTFNCIAVIPLIALSFIGNNVKLFETVAKRWKEPKTTDESEVAP
jgi:hypothetical protein